MWDRARRRPRPAPFVALAGSACFVPPVFVRTAAPRGFACFCDNWLRPILARGRCETPLEQSAESLFFGRRLVGLMLDGSHHGEGEHDAAPRHPISSLGRSRKSAASTSRAKTHSTRRCHRMVALAPRSSARSTEISSQTKNHNCNASRFPGVSLTLETIVCRRTAPRAVCQYA
jgi:hypothetical protein